MSQISLYMDEDAMDWELVRALRSRGVDVITAGEVETTGNSDEEQLTLATQQNRAIYTFNVRDFCRLHSIFLAEGRNHAGIIIGTQQAYSVGRQLRGILRLFAAKSAEEIRNQLVYLSAYIRAD